MGNSLCTDKILSGKEIQIMLKGILIYDILSVFFRDRINILILFINYKTAKGVSGSSTPAKTFDPTKVNEWQKVEFELSMYPKTYWGGTEAISYRKNNYPFYLIATSTNASDAIYIDDFKVTNVPLPENVRLDLGRMDDKVAEAVLASYDIGLDDARLRADAGQFERLRGDYPLRREFDSFVVSEKNRELERLGYNVAENC